MTAEKPHVGSTLADARIIHLESKGGISVHADVVTWAERQAALLRRIAAGEQVNEPIDWEEIAEEIASLGVSQRSSLASKVRTIIEHLAKLQASPALDPRPGWKDTIGRTRAEIEDLLEDSPSLKGKLGEVVSVQMPRGLRLATSSLAHYSETPRVPIDGIQFTTEQVISDWFPTD